MAGRQWFIANAGKQDGPFPDERLRELIANGTVRADTLVWSNGMSNWAKAAEIPGLMPSAPAQMPPRHEGPPPAPTGDIKATYTSHALSTDVGVWGLFGRWLLLAICQFLVIPFPWAATRYMRWFVDHIELPGRERVAFVGKPMDIWYVFMAYALCAYIGVIAKAAPINDTAAEALQFASLPLTAFFTILIARWFFANLVWPGQAVPLRFTGGFWGLLGWWILAALSVITVIGWAWVCTAWARWWCRNVQGSDRQLVFTASGLSFLWRTLVFIIGCALIIPIPWMLHWYTRWIVSQLSLI